MRHQRAGRYNAATLGVAGLDHDVIASWVYEHTLSSESAPPGPAALLTRLIGARSIRFVDGPTVIRFWSDQTVVDVSRGLSPPDLCVALAEVTARIAVRWLQQREATDDEVAHLAAALVMPKGAVVAAVKAAGPRLEELARIFVLPDAIVRRRMRALGIRLASGEYQSVRLLRTAG